MLAGFHVPVIPLFEVTGSEGAASFWQSGPIGVNAGMIPPETISMSIITALAH
jgi:hypothetical protein